MIWNEHKANIKNNFVSGAPGDEKKSQPGGRKNIIFGGKYTSYSKERKKADAIVAILNEL